MQPRATLGPGALVLATLVLVRADVNVMKDVTLGFGEALEHCRGESGLTEDQMDKFYDFWGEEFKFEQRELGCAIKCMSRYFDLLDDDHRMHHGKTKEFIESFPNGEVLAQHMVEIIHECEKQHDAQEDHCWRILRIAECFKEACYQRNLAPSMELLMAEFIMETEASKRR